MLPGDITVEFDAQISVTIRSLLRHGAASQEVHPIRSALTGLRASLRLLRECLGDDSYHWCNDALRDAEQQLAAVRDAEVLVVTVGQLQRSNDDVRVKRAIGTLLQVLVLERNATRARRGVARDFTACLGDIRILVKKAIRPQRAVASSATGMVRTYARCRKSFHRAQRHGSDARLHAWRKQMKYLFCQTEEMSRLNVAKVPYLQRRASLLAGYLGKDHDLAVLQSRLSDPQLRARVESTPGLIEELLQRAHRRRIGLQHKAMRLGKKCFTERPKRFRVRLARHSSHAA